jgi:hypothetical protein
MVKKTVKGKGFNNCKKRSGCKKKERSKEKLPSVEFQEYVPFQGNKNRYPQRKKQHNKLILVNHFITSGIGFLRNRYYCFTLADV